MFLELLEKRPRLKWTLGIGFCLSVPLWKYLQVPCTLSSGMVLRATVLGSLIFLLTLPAAWFVCRALFGRLLGTALLVTYGLISLFPYRVLYPGTTRFCEFVQAPPTTLVGVGGAGVLVLFFALGMGATYLLHRGEVRSYLRRLPKRKLAIYALLLALAGVQVGVRYGSRSPKSVSGGWHDKTTPYKRATFWKVRYGGWDHPLHITPSGLFRGIGAPKDYDKGKINRRSIGPYLYAQIAPYLNPYAAAVAVNFLFYLIILICGYLYARSLRLNELVSAGFSVLLSANLFVLWRTVMPYFYIPYDAAFLLILYGLVTLRPLDRYATPGRLLQFGSLLVLAGIAYDPNLIFLAVLLWAAVRGVGWGRRPHGRVLLTGLGLAALPVLVQRGWEGILKAMAVAGADVDAVQRGLFMKKVFGLPGHFLEEPWECLQIVDTSLSKLVLSNRFDTARVEYWAVLGVLGLVALFGLLPRRARREGYRDLMLLFAASVLMGVLVSLAAALPPRTKIDIFAVDPMRTSSAVYMALVLGQAVGLHYLAGKAAPPGALRLRNGLFVALVVLVWGLSFGRLLWA